MPRVKTEIQLPMTSADHHEAAAKHHEEAAESHRNAAAHYAYGDYQQASEQGRLAKDFGKRAEEHCTWALE